jgi:hypothetical protein
VEILFPINQQGTVHKQPSPVTGRFLCIASHDMLPDRAAGFPVDFPAREKWYHHVALEIQT